MNCQWTRLGVSCSEAATQARYKPLIERHKFYCDDHAAKVDEFEQPRRRLWPSPPDLGRPMTSITESSIELEASVDRAIQAFREVVERRASERSEQPLIQSE
jgi:hypothetical protein